MVELALRMPRRAVDWPALERGERMFERTLRAGRARAKFEDVSRGSRSMVVNSLPHRCVFAAGSPATHADDLKL